MRSIHDRHARLYPPALILSGLMIVVISGADAEMFLAGGRANCRTRCRTGGGADRRAVAL